ncbi:hypothetical protein [uncultured Anaerococcus sp.]|uniref:hypothetical protein n=1 Tax=uncultured Anaerococcus sp. TaxID=293428 RepID=UPI0025D02B49|nr:hypothetical protein [uncultured Anaerococcus sp.]
MSIYLFEYLVQILGGLGLSYFRGYGDLEFIFFIIYIAGIIMMVYHNYKIMDKSWMAYINFDLIFVIIVIGIPKSFDLNGFEIPIMVIVGLIYAYLMDKKKHKEVEGKGDILK